MTTYPDGTDPAPKLINIAAGLNLRPIPSLASTRIRAMAHNERVTVYAEPVVSADGYNWQRVTDRFATSGWAANAINGVSSFVDAPQQDTPIYSVTVPFVGQNTATATKRNDCGVACSLMILRWRMVKAGLLDPTLITVDEMTAHTTLVTRDADGLTPDQVSALMIGYGVQNGVQTNVNNDTIKQHLQAGLPVLGQVTDAYFGGRGVGHFVVYCAVGSHGFWVNDPDIEGANFYISFSDSDKALSETKSFWPIPYVGIIPAM